MQTPLPFRSPRRITITVPYSTYQNLVTRSSEEGRSISNLAAYVLEQHLKPLNTKEGRTEALPKGAEN